MKSFYKCGFLVYRYLSKCGFRVIGIYRNSFCFLNTEALRECLKLAPWWIKILLKIDKR